MTLSLLLALAGALGASAGNGGKDRYVVAHCMPCCNAAADFRSSAWGGESNACSSALRYVGRPTDALVRRHADPVALATHEIGLAKSAGVDAFGMFLLGAMFHGGHAAAARAYWEAAKRDGTFKLYPEIWFEPDEETLERNLAELAEVREKYDDAWFRIDGRRVLYASGNGVPSNHLERICALLGGRDRVYLAMKMTPRAEDIPGVVKYYHRPTPPDRLRLADAAMFGFQGDYGAVPSTRLGCAAYNRLFGLEPWYLVCPSMYHRRPKDSGFLAESLGPLAYRLQWEMAQNDASARVAYVATWNDFAEDSGIVPDTNHGDAWLHLTRIFSRRFKGLAAEPPANRLYLFHHPQVTEIPVALPPDAKPTQRHNQQHTPPTDYLALVLDTDEPCEVSVEISHLIPEGLNVLTEVARRRFGRGLSFWLLCHKLRDAMDSALPNRDPVNVPKPERKPVYPESAGDLVFDDMLAFAGEREIYVTIRRDGKSAATFRAAQPVTDRAGAGNHCTLADAWEL